MIEPDERMDMASSNGPAQTWVGNPVGRTAAPLREQVIGALRAAILDFRLAPGQRLVERELIEQLGVSRTTVREALRELTSEGLVTVVPQRGAIVTAPSLGEAEDLYDVREALESLLVHRFVERATDDQIEQLDAAVDHFEEMTADTDDVRDILDAKDEFYEVIVAGAGSAALQQLVEGLQARVRVLRATSLSETGRASAAGAELRLVVQAARERDADRAAEACAAHVRSAARIALRHLREAAASEAQETPPAV